LKKWPLLLLAATEAFVVLVAIYYEPALKDDPHHLFLPMQVIRKLARSDS
jgi:hypothetical protein